MQVTVGRRLQLLEEATGTDGPFWTRELGLGKDLWRQWRIGRSPNSVLKRQEAIVGVLDTLGYRTAPDFLGALVADEAEFAAGLEIRQSAEMASYFDMDLAAMPCVEGDRFPDGLRQLLSFGRAERSANVGMLVGPNPTAVRAVLSTWLLDPARRPSMPVLHLDARKYPDASALLARILEFVDPSGLTEARSPSEQVALLAATARARRFLMVIEHVDRYGDHDLVVREDEFRIGMPHFLLANIIFGIFLYGGQDVAARLLMTARVPLHSIPHGPFPVLRVPGSMLSITDESRLHHLDGPEAGAAEATVREIAALFPHDTATALAASVTASVAQDSPSRVPAASEREARELICALPPPEKLFLRLLAASVDGLRRDTIDLVLDANGETFRALIPSVEALDRLQRLCSPLVWECEDMTTRGRGKSLRVLNEDFRRVLIAEWEEAEIAAARRVYRRIGIIAFEAAAVPGREATPQAVAERFIQAARCLLASLDPARGDRSATGRAMRVLNPANTAAIVKWLEESRDHGGDAGAINDFVFRDLWQKRLEDGRSYRLVRSHGLIEAKIGLLQSFLHQGTLSPADMSEVVSWKPNAIEYLTSTQHIRILIEIAIAAGRAGRNEMTLRVARQAREMIPSISARRQRAVYKILSDALLRAGEIGEARRVLTEAFGALVGPGDPTGAGINGAAEAGPAETAFLRHVCAIDFLCRQGEAHTLADELSEAGRCFEAARVHSEALAPQDGPHAAAVSHFEGANGRRYVRFLIAQASRHPTSRLLYLGNALRHVERCRTVAVANGWEHDIASLAIDRVRLSRLGLANSHLRPDDLLDKIRQAEDLTRSFGVSGIAALEVLAERARVHSCLAGLGLECDRNLAEGQRAARHLLDAARVSRLPVFEAEALLLLGELREPGFEEHLDAHDRLCEQHGLRAYERPRTLIVHGVNATQLCAW